MKNETISKKTTQTKSKKQLGFNIAIGCLAGLGCAGTIVFGSLWCSTRNKGNGQKESTDSATIEWTENLVAEKVDDEYWEWGCKEEYDFEPQVSPKPEGTKFNSDNDAEKEYAKDASENKKIFANDIVINWIERLGDAYETFGFCPGDDIDYVLKNATEDWEHYQWLVQEFVSPQLNLKVTIDDFSYDNTHSCCIVSGEVEMLITYTVLLNGGDISQTALDPGLDFINISFKHVPMDIEFSNVSPGNGVNEWETMIPEGFYGESPFWGSTHNDWFVKISEAAGFFDQQDGDDLDYCPFDLHNFSYYFDKNNIGNYLGLVDFLYMQILTGPKGYASYYFQNVTLND